MRKGMSFRHTWKRRWFVLDVEVDGGEPRIFYFKNEKDARKQRSGAKGENALGSVALQGAHVKQEVDSEKHKNSDGVLASVQDLWSQTP